jgi:hypothetical protein
MDRTCTVHGKDEKPGEPGRWYEDNIKMDHGSLGNRVLVMDWINLA